MRVTDDQRSQLNNRGIHNSVPHGAQRQGRNNKRQSHANECSSSIVFTEELNNNENRQNKQPWNLITCSLQQDNISPISAIESLNMVE